MKHSTIFFKFLWYVLTVCLVVATIIGENFGEETTRQYIYSNIFFFLGWAFLWGCHIVKCFHSKLYRISKIKFCLSFSPLWLLLGSGCTLFGCPTEIGKTFIYIGFAWFILFYISTLCSKNGTFRSLLRKLSLTAILFTSVTTNLLAQRTIDERTAEAMQDVVVMYAGRQMPLLSMCDDILYEISGSTHFKSFSSIQVVFGWVLFPEDWITQPIVKISGTEIQKKHPREKCVEPAFFFSKNGDFVYGNDNGTPDNQSIKKISERLYILQQLRLGTAFKLFPKNDIWHSPVDDLSAFSSDDRKFIQNFFKSLYINTINEDYESNAKLIKTVKNFQFPHIGYPAKITAETQYIKWHTWLGHGAYALILAIIIFVLQTFHFQSETSRCILLIIKYLAIILLILVAFHWAWRWYLSGHIPVSTGYETLLFLSMLILLITIILWNKNSFIPLSGLMLSGFTLLVMNFSFNSPKISKLAPILDTQWLSLHVCVTMAAYATLAFTFIIAVIYLIFNFMDKESASKMENLSDLSRLLLIPGVGLLAIGIILGSFWGEIAWKTYWNWDPKEVWALITLMMYIPATQLDIFQNFKKPTFYHLYLMLAFACLLVTYFGVNYWFGGLHSYGG
ncbi:MAG: cytochrome c biogenesis protein CcsA [Bacteroidales bacterium]|nr:cytochrome c biogenesis protein CcsA [Bacteroidales bacterium]